MNPAFAIVRSSALTDPVFWAAVAMAAGAYVFYRGFGLLQRQRLITNIPRSTVRGAAVGLVEVCGKATGPYTLISPLSALECLYYRAVAWQSESQRWQKVAEEMLCAPLFLDDATGRMLVDPHGAQIDLAPAFSHEYADTLFSGEFMAVYISEFLRRHGISGERPIKLEEYCILPGDTLFVLGPVQENSGDDGRAGNVRFRAGTGFVSQAAADLQRRGALELLDPSARSSLSESSKQTQDSANFNLRPTVALMQSPSRDPFFISWCSQREISKTLSWQAFLYIWGGPVLILAGLWVMLQTLRTP